MRGPLIAVLLIAALCSACDNADEASDATPTLTPSPQATGTATPLAPPRTGRTLLAQSVIVNAAPVRTGNANVDATISALEAHDVDTLLARLFHVDYACSTAGSPIVCPDGVPQGTLIRAYPITCGPATYPTDARARSVIEQSLGSEPRSIVFAAMIRSPGKGSELSPLIALSAGATPDPGDDVSLWHIANDGQLIRAPGGSCDLHELAMAFAPQAMEGPMSARATCAPGEALVYGEVAEVHPQPTRYGEPALILAELDGLATATGARQLVLAPTWERFPAAGQRTPEAKLVRWLGGPTHVADVKRSDNLTVRGWRMSSCVIEAWEIARTN